MSVSLRHDLQVLDTKRIAARRAQGVGWKRIAAELGVGVGTIYRVTLEDSKTREKDSGTAAGFVNWPICSVATRRGGRLGAEVNCYPGHGCMSKKQGKKESGKATLAGVKEEMAKPRMAKSARKEEKNRAAARVVRVKRMKWKYCIEEIVFGQPIENLEGQLNDLGGGGWEVAAAFPSPTPDAHGRVFVILKQPTKSK